MYDGQPDHILNDQKHYDGGSGVNNNDINNDNVDIDNDNDYYDNHVLMAQGIKRWQCVNNDNTENNDIKNDKDDVLIMIIIITMTTH